MCFVLQSTLLRNILSKRVFNWDTCICTTDLFYVFKVEVGDSYHILYVWVVNCTLNINIISVYPSDAPISSIRRLNMADLEVQITVTTPESGGDVARHNNRYVSTDHTTCEAPRVAKLGGRNNWIHTSLPDTVCWLCRDVVTVFRIQTTGETNAQVYVYIKCILLHCNA
jgi:hypothetical protein